MLSKEQWLFLWHYWYYWCWEPCRAKLIKGWVLLLELTLIDFFGIVVLNCWTLQEVQLSTVSQKYLSYMNKVYSRTAVTLTGLFGCCQVLHLNSSKLSHYWLHWPEENSINVQTSQQVLMIFAVHSSKQRAGVITVEMSNGQETSEIKHR